MSNVYSKAVAAIADDRAISATNKKRAQSLALLAAQKNVHALLKSANVEAARFDKRALYATEKCIKFVAAIAQEHVSVSDFNENAFATFKTVLLCIDASENITRDDLRASLSSDVKLDSKRAEHVYRRKSILASSTLDAQSQQVCDMLRTLNVTKEIAKNVFAIDAENAIVQRARVMISELSL